MKLIAKVLVLPTAFVLGTFAASFLLFSEPTYIFSIPLPSKPDPQITPIKAPSIAETVAEEVSVCDLKDAPAKYNHSVVKVSGYFSRGFEDSSLYDPRCKSRQWIWVELGGKKSVGVMYCCGFSPKRTREDELEVEGIKLSLTEDANFTKYDNFLADRKNVKATVIGTFFSGKKTQYTKDGPAVYEGYGHMGIGSLFIVQQVLSVEVTKTENH